MNKYVVVSLYADQGPRAAEFADLRVKLSGTNTAPLYVVRDPFTDKVFSFHDYNEAMDATFAEKLERGRRRFDRADSRRGPIEAAKK